MNFVYYIFVVPLTVWALYKRAKEIVIAVKTKDMSKLKMAVFMLGGSLVLFGLITWFTYIRDTLKFPFF
jgi:hypothetical protein